jgi:hypothetical protein
MNKSIVIGWIVLGGLTFLWNLVAIKKVVLSFKQQLLERNLETGQLIHPIVILMGFLFYTSANFLALLYGLKFASAPPIVFKYTMFPALLPALLFLYYLGKASFTEPVTGIVSMKSLLLWPVWASSVFIFLYIFHPEYMTDMKPQSYINTSLWVVLNLLSPWFLLKWVTWRKLSPKIKT